MKFLIKILYIAASILSLGLLAFSVFCLFTPSMPGLILCIFTLVAALSLFVLVTIGYRTRKTLWAESARLKYSDQSTGLGNYDKLTEDFGSLNDKTGLVFVLIQIRGFQRISTMFGMEIASEMIHRLSPYMKKFAKGQNGRAYRLSLDSFVILGNCEDEKAFLSDLKLMIADMEQVKVQDNQHIVYTYHYAFTYGVYFFSQKDEMNDDIQKLIRLTEGAFQKQENSGTGDTMCTVFDEASKPDWLLHEALQKDLRRAWEHREFVPYYQLVYDLDSGKPIGAELLTRWKHPEHGILSPNVFVPIMEAEGLIMELDFYMLEEACKRIKGWIDKEDVTVPLSINLSKLNLHRPEFVDRMISIVESYDVPPVLIELELTEAIMIFEKNEVIVELAKKLHDYGFTLTMDRFSENDMTSINLLRDIPVDVVKASNNFFRNVTFSKRDRSFVLSTIKMIREMGIRMVAVGLEDAEHANLYRDLGITMAQGYYFSPPINEEEFEKQIFE